MTLQEARELAQEATKILGSKLYAYDVASEIDPRFYSFQILQPNPAYNPVIDGFTVNAVTGEVWTVWSCKYLTSPGLRKLQAVVRKRLTLTPQQLKAFHVKKPFCDY